jgi:hypothetical protein
MNIGERRSRNWMSPDSGDKVRKKGRSTFTLPMGENQKLGMPKHASF